jgi:hypothetical protein
MIILYININENYKIKKSFVSSSCEEIRTIISDLFIYIYDIV